jgi:hypothetical protein
MLHEFLQSRDSWLVTWSVLLHWHDESSLDMHQGPQGCSPGRYPSSGHSWSHFDRGDPSPRTRPFPLVKDLLEFYCHYHIAQARNDES